METFHAIFENGVIRPMVPVSFPDPCEMEVQAKVVDGQPGQNLDAIYAAMDLRFDSGEGDVAARHNEHQP
jgi:predicted DNA-binding antitoxin AbrB/MazE fold protein